MKPFLLVLLSASILAACDRTTSGSADHGHDHAAPASAGAHSDAHASELTAQSITHFTDRTELFVEFEPLIVGQESRFAAHLTWLSDPKNAAAGFRPVTEGRATLTLAGPAGEQTFAVDAPKSPGIFRPMAKPQHAGGHQARLRLESAEGVVVHDLGEVTVHADQHAALHAQDEETASGGEIAFLKEQQWKIDFATAAVGERVIRDSIAAAGQIRAAGGREAQVVAPSAGLIAVAGGNFPRIGQQVKKGELLAYLVPRLGGESDAATLALSARRAELGVEQARRERERLEGLFAAEAIPERRLIDARAQEQLARAELGAAQQRLAPYQGSAGGLPVRAPLSGVLIDVKAAPGAAVEAGQSLLHIADLNRVWLEVSVPESQVGKLRQASGAWFRLDGYERTFDLEVGRNARRVALGGVIDKNSRTVPLIFEFDNHNSGLPVGLSAQVQVATGQTQQAVALPASAVIDDNGQAVVFVQKSGEAFERRPVVLGPRDGDVFAVRSGLNAGERIVTRGAYYVRLASTAPAAIGAGHVH